MKINEMLKLEKSIDSVAEAMDKATKIIQALREENKKHQEAVDYVKQWLNETIDEGSSDSIEEDSANLLSNIKAILGE